MEIIPEKPSGRHYALIALLVISIASVAVSTTSEKVFRALDAVAIVFGILGLSLTLHQITKLKSASEAAAAAAKQATDNLSFFLRATEIGRILRFIDEVKQYHRDRKPDVAILRLQDLRNDVIFLSNNPSMLALLDAETFATYIRDISVLIAGIEKDIQHGTDAMDYVKANRQLDRISSGLTHLDSRIKQQEPLTWKTRT